jgi:hypothetical protein
MNAGKISAIVVFLLFFSVLPNSAQAKYSGGSGEPNDPYKIATATDLNDIGNHIEDFNKSFLITSDINLAQYTGSQFKIIGNSTNPFRGVFDGNGHTVSNFSYNSNRSNVGLFGVTTVATIKNLGIINPDVDAGSGDRVGGLVGFLDGSGGVKNCFVQGGHIIGDTLVGGLVGSKYYNTLIQDCWSSSEVYGTTYVGGLVGDNFDSDIYRCYAAGPVFGINRVGGLVGEHSYMRLVECYATGNVTKFGTGTPNFHGGLVGYLRDGGIYNSYALGSVTGKYYAAGLVGYMEDADVNTCYSAGFVSGSSSYTGGLVARKDSDSHIYYSFWDVNTSGQLTSAGGTGKTTVQMKTKSTFTSAGWDFFAFWLIDEGIDYPELRWNVPNGKYNGGSGTPNDPYRISDAAYLIALGNYTSDMDKYFILTDDINLDPNLPGNKTFTSAVIADYWNPFTGVFNGNGRSIRNLYINSNADHVNYLGLFGYVSGGQIKNIFMENANITTGIYSSRSGSLVGSLDNGCVSCCASISFISAGTDSSFIGGLVGKNDYGSVIDCYAEGNITVTNGSANGGLVGGQHCGQIKNCYSTVAGNISGVLTGGSFGGSFIYNSYFLNSAGPNNGYGTPLTDSQMKQQASFAGWDFVWETANGPNDVWAICEGVSYPKLAWQYVVGDSDNDKDIDFIDFAEMASRWLQSDSSFYCGGADLTGDGWVDWEDLKIMCDHWLEEL